MALGPQLLGFCIPPRQEGAGEAPQTLIRQSIMSVALKSGTLERFWMREGLLAHAEAFYGLFIKLKNPP